jgi:hypothetical protein
VEALVEKERQDETQFTTKIDGFGSFIPPWMLMYSFEGFFKNLILCMTKLRVLYFYHLTDLDHRNIILYKFEANPMNEEYPKINFHKKHKQCFHYLINFLNIYFGYSTSILCTFILFRNVYKNIMWHFLGSNVFMFLCFYVNNDIVFE